MKKDLLYSPVFLNEQNLYTGYLHRHKWKMPANMWKDTEIHQ